MNKTSRSDQQPSIRENVSPITIFAIPKPFKGLINTIQRNAITSWSLLRPAPEIILFGNEKGISSIAKELKLRHEPEIKKNEFGTPLINDAFTQAQRIASHDTLLFINSDIALLGNFMPAVNKTRRTFKKSLMIGHRINIDLNARIDFSDPGWEHALRRQLNKRGTLSFFSHYAIDYFVFSKYLWPKIPAFAVGRARYDDWLVAQALIARHPVIDLSQCVIAVHQNHHYNHLAGGATAAHSSGEESLRNIALLPRGKARKSKGSIGHATWELTPLFFVRRSPTRLNKGIYCYYWPREIRLLFLQSLIHMFLGKPESTLEILNMILHIDKANCRVYYFRALTYLRLGKRKKALADVQKVLKLSPTLKEAKDLFKKIT